VKFKPTKYKPMMSECPICFGEKPLLMLHPPHQACAECVNKEMNHRMNKNSCSRACFVVPDCYGDMSEATLRRAGVDMERLGNVEVMQAMQADPEFANYRKCTNPNCPNGWVHEGGTAQPIMRCPCGHRSCFVCEVEYHEGLTCEEYRAAHPLVPPTPPADAVKCPQCDNSYLKDEECSIVICCTRCVGGVHQCRKTPDCNFGQGCGYVFCWSCKAGHVGSEKNKAVEHVKDKCYFADRQENLDSFEIQLLAQVMDGL